MQAHHANLPIAPTYNPSCAKLKYGSVLREAHKQNPLRHRMKRARLFRSFENIHDSKFLAAEYGPRGVEDTSKQFVSQSSLHLLQNQLREEQTQQRSGKPVTRNAPQKKFFSSRRQSQKS